MQTHTEVSTHAHTDRDEFIHGLKTHSNAKVFWQCRLIKTYLTQATTLTRRLHRSAE